MRQKQPLRLISWFVWDLVKAPVHQIMQSQYGKQYAPSKPMNHSPICSITVAVFIWCELLYNKQGHNLLSIDSTNVVSSVGLLSDGNPQQGCQPVSVTTD